jgi:hypothetical protein
MKCTQNDWKNQEKTFSISSTISDFFQEFHLGTLLNRSGITKVRGISPTRIFHDIFCLSFIRKNLYQGIVQNSALEYRKDAAYDYLKNPRYNWRRLLLFFATKVSVYFSGLTDDSREKVLILDDSIWDRSRSKTVELLARVFDHCTHRYLKGFRILSIGWSDGASFVPLDFALLSSAKEQNRFQGITKTIDKRTCGYQRRKEAIQPSTDLLESLVKRVLAGIKAQYILMDSWFAFPKTIHTLHTHLPVICMLKRMPNVFYWHRGHKLNLSRLYQHIKKRRGKARIFASVVVAMTNGQRAKIVFVRDKRKTDWLAILSTDCNLSEEEIVRIYGKRWDIEVFFKMAKNHVGMANGVLIRDFDGLIAHTTISMIRYIFIVFEKRIHDDARTFGEVFIAYCDEIRDLSILEALKRILALIMDKIQAWHACSERLVQNSIDEILSATNRFFNGLQPLETQPFN